jgi:hypothetical protein
MATRILGPTGGKRRRRLLLLLPVLALGMMVLAIGASAGPIATAQGFQDDDGNLIDDGAGIDWNTFDPVTWTPHPATTPTRQATKVSNGFQFLGIEDYQATTVDSGFAGGTKQDANCPSVITAKADNKADLKRIYVASTNVGGETYLDLAWIRIPQNTTSPSAHIAFEFNQGSSACGSGGLVNRTAGDLLVVYDFEGGTTDVPTITIRKWISSGACEISNDSAPCWGVAQNLTQAGFAEAKVLVGSTASDALAPPALNSTTGTSVATTIGDREFGEAGLDLGPNGANIFPAGQCVTFGKVFGVSRTSGNSGTAQMKDLVGPGNFTLSNCGAVKIIKHTDPRGLDQNFSYTSNLAGSQISCTGDATPASFTLNDKDNSTSDSAGNTENCTNVPVGNYTVTEGSDPSGYVFESLVCTSSGAGTSATPSTLSTTLKAASITMAGGGLVTCTYVNQQQLGAIQISKTTMKASNDPLAGAVFDISTDAADTDTVATVTTDSNGLACADNLGFGTYYVTEVTPPTGYQIDDSSGNSVVVNNNAECSDDPYGGETIPFTDTPLTDLVITATSQVSGGTASSIQCTDGAADAFPGTDIGDSPVGDPTPVDPAEVNATDLAPGTYTCQVVIDP